MRIATQELKTLLLEKGADLVGFGDLEEISGEAATLTHCISMVVRIPREIVLGITDGPTTEYFEAYHSLNAKLDTLAELAAAYLL